MAEAWRTISVALVADTAKYESQLASASKTTAQLGTHTSKLGSGASKSSGIWSKAMGSMSAATVALGTAVGLGTTQIVGKLVQLGTAAIDTAGQIETSQAALTGLYDSAEVATTTMDGLRKVASGSSLQFTGYTKAAEALAYAGVEGERTVGILENVGKAIVATGGDTSGLTAASDALLKMVNLGTVGRRELVSLSNTGVPIIEGLATHLGVTIEEVNTLVSEGKVGLEDVLSVMEQGTGKYFQSQIAAADEVERTWAKTWERWKDNATVAVARVVSYVMPRLTSLFEGVVGVVTGIGDRLGTVFGNVADTWDSLMTLAATGREMFQPILEVVATLAGGAILGGLTVLSELLSAVAGFLEDNAQAAQIFAGALGAMWAVSKFRAGASIVIDALETFQLRAMYARDGAVKFLGSWRNIGRMAAAAGAIALITGGLRGLSDASNKAQASVDVVIGGAHGKGMQGLRDAINETAERGREAAGIVESYGNTANRVMHGTFQTFGAGLGLVSNNLGEANEESKKYLEANRELIEHHSTMESHLEKLGIRYGLTATQVEGLALQNEDLNFATATTEEVTESVQAALAEAGDTMGVTGEQAAGMAAAMGFSGEAAEEAMEAIGKAGDAAAEAVLSFADLASHDFGLDEGQIPSADHFTEFYQNVLAETRSFRDGIQTLIREGYDPGLVTRLLQEGPEKAGPKVEGLVQSHSDAMKRMVNTAEKEIREMSAQVAQQARLTQQAIMADTDELARRLPEAQELLQHTLDGLKVEEIAVEMGLSEESVGKLATDFGITVAWLEDKAASSRAVVPLGASTKEIDGAIQRVLTDLSKISTSPGLDPKLTMRVDAFLQDADMVDHAIGELERDRTSLIMADAPQSDIDGVQMQIDELTAAQEAHIIAKLEGRELTATELKLAVLTAKRDAMVEANAPQAKIDGVNRRLLDLERQREAPVNAEAKNTGKAGSDIDGVANKPRTAHIAVKPNTSGFLGLIAGLRNQVEQQQWRVRVTADTFASHPALGGAYGRYGGFHAFATGGIRPLGIGGVTRTPVVAFGEPETGGEAYIPRLGISDTRAKKILDVAAGWHGMTVMPTAQATAPAGGNTVVHMPVTVTAGGGVDGRQIATQVRDMIRQELPTITRAVGRARGQAMAVTGR